MLVPPPCLNLVVGAVPLPALSALEQVGLGALDLGQLRRVDAGLDERGALGTNLGTSKDGEVGTVKERRRRRRNRLGRPPILLLIP